MAQKPVFVLASGSPRRRELLSLGGWMFNVIPARVDESPLPGEAPQNYVLRIAENKARAVGASSRTGTIVLAADTTVVHEEQILGKPANAREAMEMLQSMRKRTHQVYTGLAVLRAANETLLTDLACTDVPMRDYTEEEMQAYVASGDPFDKAGGYAIQHPGFKPVETLSGCYANVVSLPLCHLLRTLAKLDLHPLDDVPQACQTTLDYQCPVYQEVLRGNP